MRSVAGWLLLFCFGILIPTAAAPLRVCLEEERILIAETGGPTKCCDDCTRDTGDPDPCCVDIEPLPDSSAPQPATELPPLMVADVPDRLTGSPVFVESNRCVAACFEPIRGPTSPAAYRAVLGIWRL